MVIITTLLFIPLYQVVIKKFIVVRQVLCSDLTNLVGPIGPRNSTSFTRPFLAGRHMWAGYMTSVGGGEPEQGLAFTSILLHMSTVFTCQAELHDLCTRL